VLKLFRAPACSRKKGTYLSIISVICILIIIVPTSGCVYLVHNSSNIILWSRNQGSYNDSSILGIVSDSKAIYLVGWKTPTPGAYFHDKTVIMKYDFNGILIWNRTWGRDLSNIGWALAVDNTALYVTGVTTNYTNIPITTNAFILKYDQNGILLWNRTGLGETSSSTISVDSNYIYLSLNRKEYGGRTFQLSMNKYNLDGEFISNSTWNGSIQKNDAILEMTAFSSSTYVSGVTDTGGGIGNGFLIKYDMASGEMWNRSLGKSITVNSTMTAVSSTAIYVTGSIGLPFSGTICIFKYTTNGDLLWNRTFNVENGGSNYYHNAIDSSSVYLYGIAEGKFIIIKYSSSGYLQWKKIWGNKKRDPQALGINVNAFGIYVIGIESWALSLTKIANK